METTSPLPGVRAADVGDGGQDSYYTGSRGDLRAMIPHVARRALDVGCGSGSLGAALAAETGAEVHGIEVFEDAAAVAETQLHRVLRLDLQSLTELPYPAGHFDVMTFGDVLEHLFDPEGLLRTLKHYLSADGVIVCSIPNVKHWSVMANVLIHDRWTYGDSGLLDRTHVHFFTLTEISDMLDRVGFEVIELHGTMPGTMPPDLVLLAQLAGQFGADVAETQAQLDAYQYIFAARPI